MAALPGDTLLAFAESRVNAMRDPLDINLVMKHSQDGGRTWSPVVVLLDQGNRTFHSPCPAGDAHTRSVVLPFCVGREALLLASGRDPGLTRSEPRNLSPELGRGSWTWCHKGPGNGIQMTPRGLLIPTSLKDPIGVPCDDRSQMWKLGGPVGRGRVAHVLERTVGALGTNLRNACGSHRIVVCRPDCGRNWETRIEDEGLPDAGTEASILHASTEAPPGMDRVGLSNLGEPYCGEMTLRPSHDEDAPCPVS